MLGFYLSDQWETFFSRFPINQEGQNPQFHDNVDPALQHPQGPGSAPVGMIPGAGAPGRPNLSALGPPANPAGRGGVEMNDGHDAHRGGGTQYPYSATRAGSAGGANE